jgi:hypothetical protein
MSNLNETSALTLAKKAISLINHQTTQSYEVTKLLESRDNSAAAIYIHTNGGTEETIKIHADQGTTTRSVNIVSDVGGIAVTSGLNAANAVFIHANGGTAETIKIRANQGTSATDAAASVQLTSEVGGINLYSGLNAANAIYLHANGGTAETVKIHSDRGTSATSVNIVSDAGGITLDASSNVVVSNTLVFKSPVTQITTTKTVTAAESGTVFAVFQESEGSYDIVLPPAAAGLKYTFVCSGGSDNNVYIHTSDYQPHIYGSVFSSANGHTNDLGRNIIDLTPETEIGDCVEIIGVTSSIWCVKAFCKTDDAISIYND